MFRRKPPGDIAQAVIALMGDPARWRPGFLCVRHTETDLVVHNLGFFITACVGEVSYRFEGRDHWVVDRAYEKLKKRIAQHRQAEAAGRMREALKLPADAAPALSQPEESLEQVEERVRRLREAVLRAAT